VLTRRRGDSGSGQRWLPPAANAVVSAALLLLIALIALPASQTPPPAIAEFSPNPQEQITEERPEQSSASGEGANGTGGGAGATTTTTSTTTTTVQGQDGSAEQPVDRRRVRRCVGNPPRQTEDPHSPPCVNYFDPEADNGGATWKGVTANEVRIAVPEYCNIAEALMPHFNSRFEFYGRKLVMECVSGDSGSVEEMVAKAVEVDEEVGAFASTTLGDRTGREYVYYDELARREVVSVHGLPTMADEARFARYHPYQWTYLPPFDVMSRNKAEWICNALAGKRAEFAGGAEATKTRKFALVVTTTTDGHKPDVGPMKSVLKGCGVDVSGQEYEIVKRDGDDAAGLSQAQDIILQMQGAGVTSVICECHTQSSGFFMSPIAGKQGYQPEWLIGTYYYQAEDIHIQYNEKTQMVHSFGPQWWNKQLPFEESPWWWALRDADPDFKFGYAPFDFYAARQLWGSISLLAAGIQLAGPELTPQTFAAGLQKAQWPNPNYGKAPYWQADVGFGGSHSFIRDAALVWGSTAPSNWGNIAGAYCYARQGVRYRFGSWPRDNAGLYEQPCY